MFYYFHENYRIPSIILQGGYPGQQYGGGGYGGGGYGGGYGAPPPQQPGVSPEIQNIFRNVDKDNSGKINSKELQAALINGRGDHFSDTACNLMIGERTFG